ncbi:MAG: 3'-5' exonuclease [Bdellovibrionales bacterium]|nr:3'-5' exonuclease [Bdellovibrionales bacterium]
MYNFIAFDLETTGTKPGIDEIVEIGAVKFVNSKATDSFEILVKTTKPIPAEATKVHGITNEMLKDATSLEQSLVKFAEFCGDTILVAHNAAFDVKFLTHFINQLQVAAPSGLVIDSYKIAKQTMKDLYNFRLEGLAKHFSLKLGKFHRAKDDSRMCGEVFIELVKNLSTTRGESLVSIETLINLTGSEMKLPQFVPAAQQMGLF